MEYKQWLDNWLLQNSIENKRTFFLSTLFWFTSSFVLYRWRIIMKLNIPNGLDSTIPSFLYALFGQHLKYY